MGKSRQHTQLLHAVKPANHPANMVLPAQVAEQHPVLPPEQQASYSAIIDSILASSDLNTISAKTIRKGLQARVDYDLTPQKVKS